MKKTVDFIDFKTQTKNKIMKLVIVLIMVLWSIAINAQVVSTFAGSGPITGNSVDGVGSSATFKDPHAITCDGNGNLYVAEVGKLRKITPTASVSTIAGSIAGIGTYNWGVAIDGNGNCYLTDKTANEIKKVTPSGVVSTFAGSGTASSVDGTGIGASFNGPSGIAIDGSGNLYVSEYNGRKIRKITPAGVVSTLAGTGASGNADGAGNVATFNGLHGLIVDGSGNVYIADGGNHKIRKITPSGVVSTIAGSGSAGSADGIGTAATFNIPYGITIDGNGNLYIADTGNNKIRKITPAGVVSTVAGTGIAGSTNGNASVAKFDTPTDLTVSSNGNLYVVDSDNGKIREIVLCVSPTVTAAFSSTVLCIGQSSTLTITGSASSYSLNSAATATTVILSPTITTTYTITGIDAVGGCSNTAIQTITVNALPNVTANATNSVICNGNSTTLTGSGANTYNWTGGVANGVAFTPTATTTYTVTGTNTLTGCTNTAIQTITVNNLPTITVNTTNYVICNGNSTTLTSSGANTYTWTGGITNGIAFTPTTTTTYTVTGTNTLTGCSNIAVQTITVNNLPTIIISTNATNSTVCNGASVILSANGANTYTWTGGITNGIAFTPTTTTTYTVTGTNTLTGCTNTAIQTITVNPLPIVTANATHSVICNGNSVILTGGGANTYTWTSGVTNGIPFTPTTTATYTVTGTNTLTGCTNTAIQTVTVNSLPVISAVSNYSLLCIGQTALLSFGIGATSYSLNSVAISPTVPVTISPTVTTTYTVSGTDNNGCTNSSTFTQSVSTCSGMLEIEKNASFLIYPNPNNGVFTIETFRPMKLSVVNELGQIIKTLSLSETNYYKTSIEHLPHGIYFIIGQNNNFISKQKIIVTH